MSYYWKNFTSWIPHYAPLATYTAYITTYLWLPQNSLASFANFKSALIRLIPLLNFQYIPVFVHQTYILINIKDLVEKNVIIKLNLKVYAKL